MRGSLIRSAIRDRHMSLSFQADASSANAARTQVRESIGQVSPQPDSPSLDTLSTIMLSSVR
jgi:hypothetical protein